MKTVFDGLLLASEAMPYADNNTLYIVQSNYRALEHIQFSACFKREHIHPANTVAIFKVTIAKGTLHERLGAKLLTF